VPAVVSLGGALNCAIEECEVAHVGTYGIWLGRGCKDNRLVQNELHDLGAGGFRIGEDHMAKEDVSEASRNLVHNNYIHDGGHVYAAGVGIWVAQSGQNTIAHNEIHDLDYSGMSIGWNWNDAPNRTKANVIEYNHIHHVLRGVLSDGGGIYTLGSQPGAVLRGNVIHDVFAYEAPTIAWGIYLDAGSNSLLIENNLCYNTHTGGIMLGGAHDCIVRNNIFARAATAQVWRPRGKGVVFERNICDVAQGGLFQAGWGGAVEPAWDYNLYYRSDGQPLLFCEDTFEEWKARGIDAHSVVADPMFVNAAACDFRLKPESPALGLGFKAFDFSKAGLEGPQEWVQKPKAVAFKPTVLPPVPPPPKPTPVDDGFEETPVGGVPALATVSGEEKGASIRVTEEAAASGKHSLKISDAPGLPHVWEPHFFYNPNFRKGIARCSFDLRLEKGVAPRAMGYEWRDWRRNPYDVGPSFHIDERGQVTAGGQVLLSIPTGEWVRFEIVCPLGEKATGSYDLTVTVRGQKAEVFEGLPCGAANFKAVTWIGFTSLATEKAVFYLDNMKVSAE
jgi:parallel beta-helix repeat protein